MFEIPMTLNHIAQLRRAFERVPLSSHEHYHDGLMLIENNRFHNYRISSSDETSLKLHLLWKGTALHEEAMVNVIEDSIGGPLRFSCSICKENSKAANSCEHQWASYILLWKCLAQEAEQLKDPDLKKLSEELKKIRARHNGEASQSIETEMDNIKLDSISFFFDETSQLVNHPITKILNVDMSHKSEEVLKSQEFMSPRLWNLPEVFRKKPSAYSDQDMNIAKLQTTISDVIRYNFSNGIQLSANQVLRHRLQKKVPLELQPQGNSKPSAFSRWPLLNQKSEMFIGRSIEELEEVVQALIETIILNHKKHKVDLFLQTRSLPSKAFKINRIAFDISNELAWRIEFTEHPVLDAEIKLINRNKQSLYFYESFAVDPENGILFIHPWLRELNQLQEMLSGLSPDLLLSYRDMPVINLASEAYTKTTIRYLRARSIPLEITGGSQTLQKNQSLTEIHINENGEFYVQHQARVKGQKDLTRKGWSSQTTRYLTALTQGLPFLLNTEARDLATPTKPKRNWDIKLLKHAGALNYIFLEVLHWYFEGTLTDGAKVKQEEIFRSLHKKIHSLLISGSDEIFLKTEPLTELCSRSTLSRYEDFVDIALKTITSSESFYSETGEVVLEGIIEREWKLLFEVFKNEAFSSKGDVFKKSRVSVVDSLRMPLELSQTLVPSGFKIFYKDHPIEELSEGEFELDFSLSSNSDQKFFNWFELNPKVFLRGKEIEPDGFLNTSGAGIIEYDGKVYLIPKKQIPTLRHLKNFWQKLQQSKAESTRQKNGDKIYKLPKNQTLELLALRSTGVDIKGDREWTELCEFYDNLGKENLNYKLPESITAELKPYQTTGVQWLQDLFRLRLGALLADDMGLGKTLQTLAFLEGLREKNELGQALIVVPSSLIFNWRQEVEKFTPELKLTVFTNKDMPDLGRRLSSGEEMIVITTYGLLLEHEEFIKQYKWKVLIFDEAQNLKNITTKRTSVARSLTAQFKICLTGTPMENHYGEFYSLVDILVPGSLGRIEDFRRQFVNTENVSREQITDLKLKIKPLLLRRTKKEILDQLPDKQETKVQIAFEERQKEIYRDIALSYNQRVTDTIRDQDDKNVQLQMLTALLRLRQACSDPAALPNVKYDKIPPKIETLVDSVQEIVESGESALVFTQFLQTLEHTARVLRAANVPVFVLHGGIPTKQRQKILSDFSSAPGGAVLVMTLKTGGVGLNLTKASYVFHLEPWWNPSTENQATDRAHRLGQSKAVQVFRYIMHDSLEEKIELLKERKDQKFQSLFSATESEAEIGAGSTALSKHDFDLLLGLN